MFVLVSFFLACLVVFILLFSVQDHNVLICFSLCGPHKNIFFFQVVYHCSLFTFFFRLFSSRVATVDFPSPFGPNFCILLRHLTHCHVLTHCIHKPPFRFSSIPDTRPQYHSPNIPIMFPPYMSKPPPSYLS